jgi:hypothetical protein
MWELRRVGTQRKKGRAESRNEHKKGLNSFLTALLILYALCPF